MKSILAALWLGSVSVHVFAQAVTYDFSLSGREFTSIAPVTFGSAVSATGSFTGNDSDSSGSLDASEITAFTVTASGTGFTGGPYDLSLPSATLLAFDFSLATLEIVNLSIRNGGDTFEIRDSLSGSDPLLNGIEMIFEFGFNSETTSLDAQSVTSRPVTSVSTRPVPLMGNFALAVMALGLALLGHRRLANRLLSSH